MSRLLQPQPLQVRHWLLLLLKPLSAQLPEPLHIALHLARNLSLF